MRVLFFLAFLAAVVFGAYEWDVWNYSAPGPAPRDTVVLIVPGDGVSAISQNLVKAGAVQYAQLFAADIRVRGQAGALKAGEYAIPAHASPADIADILISGKSIQHKLTAAEGLTSDMIYAIVKNDVALEGDAGLEPTEGSLLPETYLFTHGTTRGEIISRMERDQEKFLAEHWQMRANNLPFNSRFFPGGENSIRGYKEGEASPRNSQGQLVGAETYTLGTVEFEQALTAKWSLVVFSDSLGFARRIQQYPWDTGLFSVGGGLRWHTLIGPVRLEYGYNLNPRPGDPSGTLLFSLGYPF